MEGLRMISLNANGIRSNTKRKALFQDLRKSKADVIFLQESQSTRADQHIWSAEWGGPAFYSHGLSNSRGVCILLPRNSQIQVLSTKTDHEGRYIIMQVKVGEDEVTLANLYAPTQSNGDQQVQFIRHIEEALLGMEVHSLYIGGDLNVQLTTPHNGHTQPNSANTYAYLINSLLNDFQLEDIWSVKNPASTRGTFHRNHYSARLDYWFVPTEQANGKSTIEITPHPLLDHSMLTLCVDLSVNQRGPGIWKFNNNLLKDDNFNAGLAEEIGQALQEPIDNPNIKWEWVKHKIREFTIKFTIKRNRERKHLTKNLQERLESLAQDFDLVGSPDVISEVVSIKRELREIAESKANAAIFRSKGRWSMLGEKPSAYFLGLKKHMVRGKTMMSLRNERGQVVSNNKDILALQKQYFDNIYAEDSDSLESLDSLPLSMDDVPQVPDFKRDSINRPFTPEELYTALKELNKNKSPGSDGITPELYLKFWDILKDAFMRSLEFSLREGILTDGQRLGVITLLPKKGLDKSLISNWRPITLLNSDVKIISKALANRLQFCIKDVICEDQSGFIRGRSILTNLNNIQALIDHTNATNGSGALLAVDFAKAFDTVRWDLIFHALEVFGFGEFILAVVKMLFIKSCTYNAGYVSDLIFLARGIRQGCFSSPTLFILVVELLAILVRSLKVRGLDVAGKVVRISQYADDSMIFPADFASVISLIRLIELFAKFSGLRINLQKSHLLLLGHHLHPPASLEDIKIVDKIKILGVYFQNK